MLPFTGEILANDSHVALIAGTSSVNKTTKLFKVFIVPFLATWLLGNQRFALLWKTGVLLVRATLLS